MTPLPRIALADERARWPHVEYFFARALDAPAAERAALLDAECSDDLVRADVRRLLAHHESLSSDTNADRTFLGQFDFDTASRLLQIGATQAAPTRIGRYDVIREIGCGASGIVFLGRDRALGRLVAVKVLSRWLSADPVSARRFTNEARVVSELKHPRIATIYEVGSTDDDQLFIAMAFLEGCMLRERISDGALPVAEAVGIALEVADGLIEAHAHHIIHRDIKPENIVLTDRGACIIDFGIAKLEDEAQSLPGVRLGTVAYMSPEQSFGTRVDHRTDLWSLGVVLYEMLTGVRPFRADGHAALLSNIRNDEPAALGTFRSDVPPHVVEVVQRALAKHPSDRQGSAAEFSTSLLAT